MGKSSEDLKNSIESAMRDSDLIHDITHIIINVKTTGLMAWKKNSVTVSGRVNRKTEKAEIEKILADLCADIPYENTLRVEER